MRSEDAVEVVRASLALAFPGASVEGLSKAAELVVQWGSEGVAGHLDQALTRRMLLDLMGVVGMGLVPADPEWEAGAQPARFRTWSRPEEAGDDFPFRHRPPGPDDGEPPPRRRRPDASAG
ncbi:hypothetical protein [Streptomyces sp. NPDC018347]|uniref:hypothetical protein n=1 Tax=Streptomyces sp. NPDC018347 TaxID=3157193 RepID=UPI0033CCAC6E